jgi:hypothetical protein
LGHLPYGECPNRSLFYGFAVACNPSTQPVLSAQLTEEFRNYTPICQTIQKMGRKQPVLWQNCGAKSALRLAILDKMVYNAQ